MNAHNFSGDSLSIVIEEIEQIIQTGFTPTLAIVFSSISQDFTALSDVLDSYGIDVYGATTAGEIVDNEVIEQSVVGMLLDIDPDAYCLYEAETGASTTYQIACETGVYAKERFVHPAFIISSGGITTDGEKIIAGLKDTVGEEVELYGGLAADDFQMEASYVFSNKWQTSNGILSLIIDTEKIEVDGQAANGWQSVGVPKTVTQSKGNVVYKIDDQPALDVFIKYFGLSESIDAKKDVASILGAQYPLHLMRDDDRSVIRAPLVGNPEDRSVVFAGGVPQGAKVKFSVPPGFDIVEKVVEDTHILKHRMPEADALILFSCKARHLALGPLVEDEISGLQELWDVPLVGFFTYGEIGKEPNSTCDFHNETCSLVALREKI